MTVTRAYDDSQNLIQVSSVQNRLRDDFLSTLDKSKWNIIGSDPVTSGAGLVITKDTTINTETTVVSDAVFKLPMKLCFGVTLSQRIANQTFEVGIVSVNPLTGIPDNLFKAAWLFDGTVQTTNKYRTTSAGNTTDSAGVTTTTAAGGGVFDLLIATDEVWFGTNVVNSVSSKSYAARKQANIPDPDKLYKIYIRATNGSIAPASATTLTINFVALEDYAEIVADFAQLGGTSAGQSIPVNVSNAPNVSVSNSPTVIPAPGTTSGSYASKGKTISAATTNSTLVKGSAANLGKLICINTSASIRWLKLYDKATAPTVGTDTVFHTIMLPASAQTIVDFHVGLRTSLGLGFGITANMADTDTTAIAASEVVINYEYN